MDLSYLPHEGGCFVKQIVKIATAVLAIAMVGTSLSGAAFAHGGKGKGGPMGPGMMSGQDCKGQMGGGKGGHRGMGMKGGIHQSKYMSLLVKAYAPDIKADWDTYLKAESELMTQEKAFHDSLRGTGKRFKPPVPDQATMDAHKSAHEAVRAAQKALTNAITEDKDADIATALKSLLTANKQMLVIRAQHLEAMKKAAAAAPSATAAPSTSSYKNSPSGVLQAL